MITEEAQNLQLPFFISMLQMKINGLKRCLNLSVIQASLLN